MELFENLRCRDGDLAVIIKDTPECHLNIGRIVRVKGPPTKIIKSQMAGWLIRPIRRTVLSVEELDGRLIREVVNWNSRVFHEDAWLMPIRPKELIEDFLDETESNLDADQAIQSLKNTKKPVVAKLPTASPRQPMTPLQKAEAKANQLALSRAINEKFKGGLSLANQDTP